MDIVLRWTRGRHVMQRMVFAFLLAAVAFVASAVILQDSKPAVAVTTRVYYIAADEVEWDYAPMDINNITGEPFDDEANLFVQNGPQRIGKTYVKALYREYTDGTFTTLKPRPQGGSISAR